MPSERVQRQIDRLLDEAEQAIAASDWTMVQARTGQVLALDPGNGDALAYRGAANRAMTGGDAATPAEPAPLSPPAPPPLPDAFVSGRYVVSGLLGEGGRKVVYRVRDALLKREVAFALIKTDGLDQAGRERVQREAELLARLGSHPNIVAVFDLGDEAGQPFLVTELLPGGDLQHLVAAAPDHRLPIARVLELGTAIARALAFAHAQGIVHRDLKPGNVWLAEDGTPKLGDFGLALASAAARLTRVGMMVGTALYMAPEQALGQAVTPRSDLYALGCVLYELVSGRPPFVGDEQVAILGQQLNAIPVAPAWHRPDCPKALESLILRLLEKDPARRPASAQVVVEALAGIGVAGASAAPRPAGDGPPAPTAGGAMTRGGTEDAAGDRAPSIGGEGALVPGASGAPGSPLSGRGGQPASITPSGPNPVYRRIFVGREAELRQLEAAFDAAVSGQGGLVLVVGEPGIGKTTLTEQLTTYAALRGGRTLVGHCYEEGSLSLPYLPFVEAMRSYVLEREPEHLRRDLGSSAPEVARIVSEVRDRVQVSPAPPSADPSEDRYRLLQAVASFLRSAAAVQPLVLVLEDLHDADRGTLELLQHLARQLAGTRLLLVGTYRDVEVDRQHPLSGAVAELRRGGRLERIALRGLTADEVQRMLGAIAGQAVPWALAEAVHRQTEGNPLFVQEVLRYLAEEGLITREGGRWRAGSATPLLETIPEGLRDVIGKRLSRLSAECNRLLAIAAVIGRDFQLATLAAISSDAADRVSELLDEAVKVAVLQEQAKVGALHYRFAHAFFRQTLYDELSAARRLRLHQQVARALEQQYTARIEDHAAELAEHYAQSTDAADLGKAVHFGEVAAQRASAVYAHGEAVRYLRQALDVQEVLNPDDNERLCSLLLALGEAMLVADDLRAIVDEIAPQALAIAEALADRNRAGQACYLALEALGRAAGAYMGATQEPWTWAERLDRVALPNTVYRVWADAWRGTLLVIYGRPAEAWALRQRALTLARTLGHADALAFAAAFYVSATAGRPVERAERLTVAYEMAPLTESLAGYGGRLLCEILIYTFLIEGDREAAEAQLGRLERYVERSGDARQGLVATTNRLRLMTHDGRLEEMVAAAETLAEQGEALGASLIAKAMAASASVWPLLLLGRAAEAVQALPVVPPRLVGEVNMIQRALRLLALAHAGHEDEARVELATVDAALRAAPHRWADLSLIICLVSAVTLGDVEVAGLVVAELAAGGDYGETVQPGFGTCTARFLGTLAALQGDRGEAKRRYVQALTVAARNRMRPETALTRLALAELLGAPAGPLPQPALPKGTRVAANPGGTTSEVGDGERNLVEAREHLAFCIPEFEAMKMAPSLERARKLDAALDAASDVDPAGATEDGALRPNLNASVSTAGGKPRDTDSAEGSDAASTSAPSIGGQGARRRAHESGESGSAPIHANAAGNRSPSIGG